MRSRWKSANAPAIAAPPGLFPASEGAPLDDIATIDLGRSPARGGWSGVIALAIAASAAAALTASAYWPGLMSWDPVRQYGEALSGEIEDWHPPAMQWLWRRLLPVQAGPAPMLLLQLAFYWGGLGLLAGSVWRRRPGWLAWALLACGLLPIGIALTGMIFKDCLAAGLLLLAVGLSNLRRQGSGLVWAAAAVATLFLAAVLRFNSFTACAPLLVALLPRGWRKTWPRLLVATSAAIAALLCAMPVADRLIGAKPSGVALSLIIFDLGGITDHSGVSVFPGELAVPDPVRVNHACYRPIKWDSYSNWVDPECPLGFTAWSERIAPGGASPYKLWASAIAAHPIAYAAHRLRHFAINTRLLPVSDLVERPVPREGAPNPWNFRTAPNAVSRLIDAAAIATAHSPLGWPIVWIALAFGAAVAAWRLPCAPRIVPLALSSLCYGGGYLLFSVAAELRYHLWTGIAALLATVLVIGERAAIRPRRLALAYAPALIATAVACYLRL